MSPSQTRDKEEARGFMLVYQKGYCGWLGKLLGKQVFDPQECFRLTQAAGRTAFSMGRKYRKGRCNVEVLEFKSVEEHCTQYKQWEDNPDAPTCAWSGSNSFHNSKYYDWYALEPNCNEA